MKENIGKIAQDLLQNPENKHSVIEQTNESLTDYESNIILCAERGLQSHNSDFFIVVLTKKEPLLDNVIRNYFFHRKSCPTPTFDQIVYQYIYKHDALKFLWALPDKETCLVYKDNVNFIDPKEKELLGFILEFYDGSLDRKAAELNKEPINKQFLEDVHVGPIPS